MSASGLLLTTKLYLPPARPNRVPRPRLIARLNSSRPLTLISAPAGVGKTTYQQSEIYPRQFFWLRLDSDDNDPARFLSYLIATLS